MKKVLLLGVALIIGLAVVSQAQIKGKYTCVKAVNRSGPSIEPVPSLQASPVIAPLPNHTKSTNIVTVLTLGTSANGNGWGYNGGQRRHLWADNDLKAVALTHRMGPETATTPPSFTGYLAIDHATNYGASLSDWSLNYQVMAATLNLTGSYYLDASRYPMGGIYNPAGNTDPNNAYFTYFQANFADVNNIGSSAPTWGGYGYGVSPWANQADTVGHKHISWYSPPPKRDIANGFTITPLGKAFALDLNYSYGNGYDGNLYLSSGTWNETTKDFNYTFSLLECPDPFGAQPAEYRISADPTGNHVWIGVIGNNAGAVPVFDSTYYPIFYHSADGGTTWSAGMPVTIDGPDGIPAIKNYISDARLATVYAPNAAPSRDEIPYSCAFEGDIAVDKWGNPHMAFIVCMPGTGFSIILPDGANSPKFDSTAAVFDVFSTNQGATWCGRLIGVVKHMKGLFPDATTPEYNRCNISRNATGTKIFVTYLDTWVPGATDNSSPDIFARGWDLVSNKLTNFNGHDAATNVTALSDVNYSATFGDQANLVFTKPDGSSLIPMACEALTGGSTANAVTFKYISDFSFPQSAFTIDASGPAWGTDCVSLPAGINDPVAASSLTAVIYPNPVKGIASVKINVPQKGLVTIQLTNLVGQTVMTMTRNIENTDTFTLDASQLTSGVYFYTVKQGNQKVSGKIIVE